MASTNEDLIKAQVALSRKKSLGTGLILTFLFGPIGIFYSTVLGGVIMLLLNILVGIGTLGLGLIIVWPINLIVTWLGIKSHNGKIDRAILGGLADVGSPA